MEEMRMKNVSRYVERFGVKGSKKQGILCQKYGHYLVDSKSTKKEVMREYMASFKPNLKSKDRKEGLR